MRNGPDPDDGERQRARDRAFDDLLEQELGGELPVAEIVQRALRAPQRALRAPQRAHRVPQRHEPTAARAWLVAALILLGVGVTVWSALDARRDRGDAAARQRPDQAVDLQWPLGSARVMRAGELADARPETTHLSMSMTLPVAGDLSRFPDLQHLEVRLTVKALIDVIKKGDADEGTRLAPLATAPKLRRLALAGLPLAAADLAALARLEHLQALELATLIDVDGSIRAVKAGGDRMISRPFDRALARGVAASRATTLRLAGMPLTVEGIRALAAAKLHTLIVASSDATPAVLEAIGELTTLRQLELRSFHAVSLDPADGGAIAKMGAPALSADVMRSLASLPDLEALTLRMCRLDREVLAALPRELRRLDLSTCFGVDAALAPVIAAMPDLVELGLPLQMASAEDVGSRWRPPTFGTELHTERLSGAEAAAILGERVWQRLHVDGRLTEEVAAALGNQNGLQQLFVRPTPGSAPLTFVARLPKLERITFVECAIDEAMLRACNGCASLRTAAFYECEVRGDRGALEPVLREGIASRWTTGVVW